MSSPSHSPADSASAASAVSHFRYTSDFDENGILFALGTAGRAAQHWTNPASLGLIRLSSSPLKHDSDELAAFISREAGRRGVLDDAPGNYLVLDFLSNRIAPQQYSLRHYNRSSHALRDWIFQCSHDAADWIDLRVHTHDHSLFDAGSTNTWEIPGLSARIDCQMRGGAKLDSTEFYRYFRILMTGPNSSDEYWNLSLSGFELYGLVVSQIPSPVHDFLTNIAVLPPFDDGAEERECIWSEDFNESGVIYFIGTMGGNCEWTNPVSTGLVHMTSTPLKIDSDPLQCFLSPLSASAARGVLDDRYNCNFTVDLIAYSVRPTHYALRHYNSKASHYLRNWILQGSTDGFNWINLIEHENDEKLNAKGAVASWQIPPPTDNSPMPFFRIFRIITNGVNSTGFYCNLCCSGVEFYGTLRRNSISELSGRSIPMGEVLQSARLYHIPPVEVYEPSKEIQETKIDQSLLFDSAKFRGLRNFAYHGIDFGVDGILYWLGTRFSGDWINPAALNLVSLQSSRLKHDSQPLHVFIGRESTRGVLEDQLFGWFSVRLNYHRLQLSHYTLRHYNSQNIHALRNWRIDGSADGVNWALLRDHQDDESLSGAGATATFAIARTAEAVKYYSFFRIMITGTNSTRIYRNLCTSGIELFGSLDMIQPLEENISFDSIPSLLNNLNLSDYADRFAEQKIDFNSLRLLNEADLESLIPEVGPRSRLRTWRLANGLDFQSPASAIESVRLGLESVKLDQNNEFPALANAFELCLKSLVGSSDRVWNAEKESVVNELKLELHISDEVYKQILNKLGLAENQLAEMKKKNVSAELPESQQFPDCLICMCALADHVIIPCMHLNLCGPCSERVQRQGPEPTCPTCRTKIVSIKRVYV